MRNLSAVKYPASVIEQRDRERKIVAAFREAVRTSDRKKLIPSFATAVNEFLMPAALNAIRKLPPPSLECRRMFLAIWVKEGDGIRDRFTEKDSDLIDALWKLLPPYDGPALTLSRLLFPRTATPRLRHCTVGEP